MSLLAQLPECTLSSMSSDSGLSTNSLWTAAAGTEVQKTTLRCSMAAEQPHVHVLTSEITITSDRDVRAAGDSFHHIDPAFHVNGKSMSAQRETNILNDEDGCTSAIVVSDSTETDIKLPVLSRCEYSVQSGDAGDGVHPDDTRTRASLSSDQTHLWVKQQQLVSPDSYIYNMSDRLEQKAESGNKIDSLEPNTDKDDEFVSLALDIDQSIEQLNQLILDLDPEFEPVPTLARGHMTCSTSVRTNGVGHLIGQVKSSQSGKISLIT